ncbi:glycosyltransferase [Mucilaginibacter sp. BT774]|uniref:glycosyltransferase n=1 Tax=Mucilaginibacter sp. BT774 TaxID=3062276 RepID=UPI00267489AB|nr:glycosyltransferase [Mucilaginibacter sp. BT774]MDO3625933.1 glycosyltransferase [Mucilaginibacter sp. BT774]
MSNQPPVSGMGKKGILYVGGFELPDKNAAAQRVVANGKLFMELGYSVYYLGIDRTLTERTPVESTKKVFEDFEYYGLKYPSGLAEWIYYLNNITDIIRIANKIDSLEYIIAYNYPAFALAKLGGWCRSRNIRLISDCTEWYDPQGNLAFKMIKGFDTYLRMKVVQPKLDGLIAISGYLYSFYASRMKNVIQVPPLVDIRAEKWTSDCIRSPKEMVLVYAGSPGSGAKDKLDDVLSALAIIKTDTKIRFLLNVVGLTKQQYIDNFGISSFPEILESEVRFKGRLSHTDALNEIKCADYAVFIRDNNLVNTAGFPTKFVEALSCGTPVLANASSNITDYLKDGENGYILDNSTSENLVRTFKFALLQGKDKIQAMKRLIKSNNIFDYRNYNELIRRFLNSVRMEK